jgi:1-acyl-sn-glycerol-3-phosphate acyltransferase
MDFDLAWWHACGWLGLLIVATCAYFFWQIRNSDYDFWESCLFLPTYLMGRLVWRVHFRNQAPEEIRQGAVLAANHRSSVDPFFVQLAAGRRVHWMVAQEYCKHWVFGPILSALQVIPTNRSGMDTAATKRAIRLTEEGRLVGMFPEGKLNTTSRTLLPIRSGAALVALKSQVPIIPLYIEGSPIGKEVWSPLFMPARVAITFGQPLWPSSNLATPMPAQNVHAADELHESDRLVLQWGRQVVTLAGRANSVVELVSKRSFRKKA